MASIPESHRDLLDSQFATIATVGAGGRPQTSVVWFLAEDGAVSVSLSSDRQKTANLQQNPACSLLIMDPTNGYRYLELRGRAEITPDPDYEFATKVGAKYGGADLRQYDKPEDTRFKVTIVPERVHAVNMGG
jgi:PPOX class probable F420-dependent enzyme